MQDVTHQSANVPALVRQARERKRLSREGLAYLAGVSLKTIERIEQGKSFPHRSTQHVIAAVLEVEPDELFPPEPAGAAA